MYLTTAIAYVNGKPHVGHAYELIVADAIARHHRLKGDAVFLSTGTDEHGLKIQKAARALTGNDDLTQLFVDSNALRFVELAELLNVSYDKFIRTTSKEHKNAVRKVWGIFQEKGLLYTSEYRGWYSVTDECLYTDEEVYDNTVSGFIIKCAKATQSVVEPYTEKNTFFKLSAFKDQLLEWYKTNPIFPENRANEIINIVSNDLRDLSVSRANVKWGIPVPDDESQTIYVWIDALTNYLTAIGWPDNPDWVNKWPAIHVIGKDILKFHSIYWPAILLALGLPLPKIVTHGWILDDSGRKQAKSEGNVVDPFEIVETFGIDALRFHLLSNISFGEDGCFGNESLTVSLNTLANNYGNLVNRILTFIHKNFNGYISYRLDKQTEVKYKEIIQAFDEYNFNQGISLAFESIARLNAKFQNAEPWNLIKTDRLGCLLYLQDILSEIIRVTITLQCIIPNATSKILDLLGYPEKYRQYDGDSIQMDDNNPYKGWERNAFERELSKLPKPQIVFRKI